MQIRQDNKQTETEGTKRRERSEEGTHMQQKERKEKKNIKVLLKKFVEGKKETQIDADVERQNNRLTEKLQKKRKRKKKVGEADTHILYSVFLFSILSLPFLANTFFPSFPL